MPIEPGVYVTFFTEGESFERELPPVGPLDHVVVRHKQLVADRKSVHQAEDTGVPIDRWLEAELELQRAMGVEPGGARRQDLRITAPDGVLLRFAAFGDPREPSPVPELGPFAVVTVRRGLVEADGVTLATRRSSELASWELEPGAGGEYAGLHKNDIGFRTLGTAYHAAIGPGPQRVRGEATAPLPPPAATYSPPPPAVAYPEPEPEPPPVAYTPRPSPPTSPPPAAPEPPALTERDLALIARIDAQRTEQVLRERRQEEERRRLGVDDAEDTASTWSMRYRTQGAEAAEEVEAAPAVALDVRGLLWSLRIPLVAVLLVAIGIYGFVLMRTGAAPGASSQVSTVGIAQRVNGARWDYILNSVQRTPSAGGARARGIFVVLRVGMTNRGGEGSEVGPGGFGLVDDKGTAYGPEPLSSQVYVPPSTYTWPKTFPVGSTVTGSLVFDVDPAAKGLRLVIYDVPRTQIRVD